jgi:hypothetical protein
MKTSINHVLLNVLMDEEIFYQHFCTVMRRCGQVRLKNIAAISGVPIPEARKCLNRLVKSNKIKKIGAGPATAYMFY